MIVVLFYEEVVVLFSEEALPTYQFSLSHLVE